MHFFRTYYLQITFCDSFRSFSDIKCLYISPAFCSPAIFFVWTIFIFLKRLFLLKTLRHHHAYIECFIFLLRSHRTVPPFLIQFLLTPSFVFFISDWLPNRLDSIRKSCAIRSCLFCYLYTTILFCICQPFLSIYFIFLSFLFTLLNCICILYFTNNFVQNSVIPLTMDFL